MNKNIDSESAIPHISESEQWVSIPEVAELLHIRQRDVRTMLSKNEIVAVRRGENSALAVHRAEFVTDGSNVSVVPSLKGTLTALADVGFSDEEKLSWLLEPNQELGCAPLAALHAGRVHSVRRAIITSGI